VGAYRDRAAGRRAADRAVRLIAASVGRFAVELSPTGGRERSYRVRLVRMNRAQAHDASRVLRAQRMECAPLAPADLRTSTRVAAR
jgi:hypothetical protein